MIFPKIVAHKHPEREPFIFPTRHPRHGLAPGAITTVMIFAQQTQKPMFVMGAIILAWIPSTIILLAASNIKFLLGQKGLLACERLGGMLICLIAIQMLMTGVIHLVKEQFFT